MTQFRNQILSRIEKHTNSKSIEIDFDYLVSLQRELAPHLQEDLVEVCVIESFVKLYEDKTLDYLLYQYIGSDVDQHKTQTAA